MPRHKKPPVNTEPLTASEVFGKVPLDTWDAPEGQTHALKYEHTGKTILLDKDRSLYQIKAVRDFGDVKTGDIGGYVEFPWNLSHDGDCWIADNAQANGNALVLDNAVLKDKAVASGETRVFGDAVVGGDTVLSGYTEVGHPE